MDIKAIIFDKDGVLVDSEKLKAEAWERTLERYGVPHGYNWYLRNLGPSHLALANLAMDMFAFFADQHELAEEWTANYRCIEHRAEPITTNLEVLAALSRKYPIAVASSMDKAAIESEMRRFGYFTHIAACVSGEDVPNNKPAPDVYVAAAKTLDVASSNCVAIEDSPSGIAAAKAAGMFCIGYKNSLYDLDLSGADVSATDLSRVEVLNQSPSSFRKPIHD